MLDYQKEFIDFIIEHKVLQFGRFTLKSGRESPYFFNTGLFNTGNTIAQLGRYYAQTIHTNGLEFDVLFGPAYKGIPLVVSTAIALASLQQREIPYCFNRKETKDHGEGGLIVGAPLTGRVLLIDDVISAGTATREAVQIINANKATLTNIVIALDRQERGQNNLSAIREIQKNYNVNVTSIVNLDVLCDYLVELPDYQEILRAIHEYRTQYGVS